ncbi:MAG: Polysaccharide biosynthesis protein CapD-like [Frankiales bacterium]|nr:Polysaccharide biosynthesis protein CapD-like [Frankiales bacterium]
MSHHRPRVLETRGPVPPDRLALRPERRRARATATRGHSLLRELRTDPYLVACDVVLVVCAYAAALLLHFDVDPQEVPDDYWLHLVPFAGAAAVLYVLALGRAGLYARVWDEAGTAEAWHLFVASSSATTLLVLVDVPASPFRPLPLSVPVTAGAFVLLLLAGIRFKARIQTQRRAQPVAGTGVLVVGPLWATRAVVEQMRHEPQSGLRPVAVLTDDATCWGRQLCGVPVVGPLSQLEVLGRHYAGEQLLILPGALAVGELTGLVDLARGAGLRSRTLPDLQQSFRAPRLGDIRDIALEDLLFRDQVVVEDARVRDVIQGHRVLITGAGGSIGSEIAVQVAQLGPSELVLLDHDETHLHDVAAMLAHPARSVLGDIRDEAFVEQLLTDFRPDVVFHAAAHKHVPILEQHPVEAVRTNVHGTDVLVQAAVRAGTPRFVGISTDKAVSPHCVMGATKRLAELIVVEGASPARRFCAVRFGNVLGSRGSVVPTFLKQVRAGGPVTVTHPAMTRYFMTTREAVSLVLQAAATADGGEVFLLDMGEPVKILDLAERIIDLAGHRDDVQVQITGLRPGEKLHEELSSKDETVHPTGHGKIFRVGTQRPDVAALTAGVEELCRRAWTGDEESTRSLLFALARAPGAGQREPDRVLDLTAAATAAGGVPEQGVGPRLVSVT